MCFRVSCFPSTVYNVFPLQLYCLDKKSPAILLDAYRMEVKVKMKVTVKVKWKWSETETEVKWNWNWSEVKLKLKLKVKWSEQLNAINY